jgi:uncharacterized protein YdeI (BOF family)
MEVYMKTRSAVLTAIGIISLAAATALADVPPKPAASPDENPQGIQGTKPQPDKILKSEVRGELLKIDEDTYTVREANGKEVHMQIDKETRVDKNLKPGDKVEAKVMPQGYIWSLKKTDDAPSTSSSGPNMP